MTDEKQLIIDGIKYLSDNVKFRDMTDTGGKYGTQSPAVSYADTQNRIIRRVLDFISVSDKNNREFHDLIMELTKKGLNNDIFQLFFKMWSKQDRIYHPIEIEGTYNKIRGRWVKEGSITRG